MSTGYTYPVREGKITAFKEFAMECARAFGALVELRDDMTAPIPDAFVPSDYHSKELARSRRDLVKYVAMSLEDATAQALRTYQHALDEHFRNEEERARVKERYEFMLSKVNAWAPPTKDHQGLKDFMVQQLSDSIKFDCYQTPRKPQLQAGAQYRKVMIEEAQRSIDYHTKGQAEEVARCAGRTQWVRDLRESLNRS